MTERESIIDGLSRIDRTGKWAATRVVDDIGLPPGDSDESNYAWLMRALKRARELRQH